MKKRSKISVAIGGIAWVVIGLIIAGIYLSEPLRFILERPVVGGSNNVRQIFFGLGLYANENDGEYPDGKTANDAIRQLFVGEWLEKEDFMGCPKSSFISDGNIGNAPDFSEAAGPGENHWMYIYHPEGSSVKGVQPLLIEAPDMSTGVPLWHPERAWKTKPGRTWWGGRVIVCMTDGGVATWKTVGNKPTSKLKLGDRVIDFADPELQLRHVELR